MSCGAIKRFILSYSFVRGYRRKCVCSMATTAITSMPGFINRYTSMPGSVSIGMPESWRDTGYKALYPVSGVDNGGCACAERGQGSC